MEDRQAIDQKNEMRFLMVDQGGHASRAVVMDGSGVPVTRAERPLSTSRPQDGYVEHDPGELVRTIRQCLEEVIQAIGDDSKTVQAAAIATQRSSIVCWDGQTGKALSPVISWQDTRARERIAKLAPRTRWVHDRTGLFLSAHYGASKLQWCLENIPDIRDAKTAGRLCFGPMSSFIVWKLIEDRPFVADPVSASRTLLWNFRERNWDQELLDLFEIPGKALPVCVPTVHDYGNLKIGKACLPLTLVTGDQSAALFAHGRLRPDTVYMNMGTGAFVSRSTGKEPLLQSRLLTSIAHEQGSMSHNVLEGTVNGAGSALEWVRDALSMEDFEEKLPEWLEETKDPPLFLNGVSGLGAPYWDPEFSSEFVGEGDPRQKIVAVAESIVFLLQRNLVEMESSLPPPGRIQVTGGLSTLDGLCRLLADLTGIQVYRPAQTEATVRGTCYLLAGQPDHWPEQQPGTWFEPGYNPLITRRYERWAVEMEKRVNR